MCEKLLAAFACALAMCGAGHAQTYNAVTDFSLKSNPNGVWSYGGLSAVTGGTFTAFTTSTDNSAYPGVLSWSNGGSIPYSVSDTLNTTGSSVLISVTVDLPPNQVSIDGEDLIADLRFTAPATGVYDLSGLFQRDDIYANPVNVYVVENGTTILFSATNFTEYGSEVTFDNVGKVRLTKGSTLDFVESASQYNNDSTGLEADIVLLPAVSATTAGRYTVLLSATGTGAGVPRGTGYATMKVGRKGGVIMAGRLPDGKEFSTSGSLVSGTAGSQFMIYDTLRYRYLANEGEKGLLIGGVTFEKLGRSDFDGTLEWVKPEQKYGRYKEVIDTNLSVIGSIYTAPHHAGSVLPGFTTGTLELSDAGALSVSGTAPLVESVTLTSSNSLTVTKPDADKLTVRITPSTGAFEGTFVYPGESVPREFGGVLFQDQAIGGGFFLGPAGSGTVNLTSP
jgi:hypothetical protein